MPPPSTEHDLKRRARRRLIGAVALTLLAVIVLPLLLEDEPPPTSSLAVEMAASPATETPDEAALPGHSMPADAPIVADATKLAPLQPEPEVSESAPAQSVPVQPEPEPEPKPEPAPPRPQPPKAAPKPASKAVPRPASATAPPARTVAAGATFVVQLAALSDAAKADALKNRVAKVGLPAYTDALGKLTRVRVGPYASREAAVAAAAKLAENGLNGQVVPK
jgi:DedD protein